MRTLTSVPSGVRSRPAGRAPASRIELIDQLLTTLAAVTGTTFDNMVRGHAWMFLDMGRRVERGALTHRRCSQALLPPGASRIHMEALLEIADSLLTYRARYLSALQAAPVVDLLLTDVTQSALARISGRRHHGSSRRAARLGEVVKQPRRAHADHAAAQALDRGRREACAGDGSGLRELLEESGRLIWQFSDDVSANLVFPRPPLARALTKPGWIDEDLRHQ